MPADGDTLLTTDDVANRLSVTPQTVTRWIKDGLIPAIKLPGRQHGVWRIRPADLEAFIDSREVQP